MITSVEGFFRDGKVELLQIPPGIESSRVVVTFLPERSTIDQIGLTKDQAAELRARFGEAASDWDRPEMDVYDEP